MPLPTGREELKQYCLRELGKGAIRVNVTDEQCEDRIDEAIERFQEYHFDGQERVYYKRQLTASTLTLAANPGFTYPKGTTIKGQTSLASAKVHSHDGTTVKITHGSELRLQDNEAISDGGVLTAYTASSNCLTLGDIDNKWVPVTDDILSIIQLVPTGAFGGGLFSLNYQQALQALPVNQIGGGLSNYFMQRNYLALIEELFQGDKILRYQRSMNRLHIDLDWKNSVQVDGYLIFDAYRAVDPESAVKVYRNYFLRRYVTELIRRQWGQNLIKHKDVEMLGGTKINGDKLIDDATREIEKLEKDLEDKYQAPPGFFMG